MFKKSKPPAKKAYHKKMPSPDLKGLVNYRLPGPHLEWPEHYNFTLVSSKSAEVDILTEYPNQDEEHTIARP